MVLLITATGWFRTVRAAEPNDFPDSATSLEVQPSVPINGFLGDGPAGPADVDFYRIDFDFPGDPGIWLLTVDVAGTPPLDPFVRLFAISPGGSIQELVRNDDRSFDDHNPLLRTYLIFPSQLDQFFVAVSTAANPNYDPNSSTRRLSGSGGAYTISATIQEASLLTSRFEPNDEDATFMGEGSFEINGEFIGDGEHGRRDIDLYQITLSGPARLDIVAAAEEIDSPLEPVVQVFQSLGSENVTLGASDHNPSGTRDASLSLGIPESGDVFIAVYGNGNPIIRDPAGDHGEVGSVGPYNLSVTVILFGGGGPFEPNDSLSIATVPTVSNLAFPIGRGMPDEKTIVGFLGDGSYPLTRGDRDFYDIALYQSGFLTIQIDAPQTADSTFDPILSFYDPLGNRLQSSYPHNGTVAPIVVPLTCGAPAYYAEEHPVDYMAGTVMVMGNGQRFPNDPYVPMGDPNHEHPEEYSSGDGPGSTGSYSLDIRWQNASVACGHEPDDTIELATDTGLIDQGSYLCTNNFMGDSQCSNRTDDVDFWKFSTTQSSVSLQVTVAGCPLLATQYPTEYALIRLFDETGHEVKSKGGAIFSQNAPLVLNATLSAAGTYYIGVSDWVETYDPHTACSIQSDANDHGSYDVLFTLKSPNHFRESESKIAGVSSSREMMQASGQTAELFASAIASGIGTIDALDSSTGHSTQKFDAPEITFGGAEGLATDGSNLYFMGSGRYPRIYKLDAITGDVQSDFILSYCSGFYSDATMLGDELFVLDYREGSIHVVDPVMRRLHHTLPIASRYGIHIGGGLASASYPNRLYLADAFGAGNIYEIQPQSGALVRTIAAPNHRPVALAGIENSEIWSADWLSNSISVLDRAGGEISSLTLEGGVSSMSSTASLRSAYDATNDGNIDLRDVVIFQECFGGSSPVRPECISSDADQSGTVDLMDFAGLRRVLSGP
ncbi:MAG: hypothetical protein HYR83_15655 [Planctomycetes bacterium]|nr:hypothetical protein [Planctomycetota bacterium]